MGVHRGTLETWGMVSYVKDPESWLTLQLLVLPVVFLCPGLSSAPSSRRKRPLASLPIEVPHLLIMMSKINEPFQAGIYFQKEQGHE